LIAGIFLGSLTTFQQVTGTFDNTYWGFSKAQLSQIVGESNDWRSGGPGFGPNGFAQIMLILIPFAIERMWNERKAGLRILAGWALVVCVLSVFYTYSRGAFLGLVAIIAAMMVYRRSKPLTLMVMVFLLGASLSIMPAQYVDRLSTLTDFLPNSGENNNEVSFRGRISENIVAWRMFVDHPLTGVGLHNYSANYLNYSSDLGLDPRREARTPHNLYLEIASEMGLLGLSWLGIFLWMVIRGLRQARAQLKNINMQEYDGLIMAIGVSILGFLITSLYQHLAIPRYFWVLFGIALAIPDVIRQELKTQNQEELNEPQ
jgi:O-antigen ligase